MAEFETLLSAFEALLKKIKAPVLRSLDKGLDITTLAQMPVKLPPDAEKLYKWKNGTKAQPGDTIGGVSLFPKGIFIPIESAVEIQEEMGGNELIGWAKSKFPLFGSGAGEYLVIESDPLSKDYGMLFFHSVGAVDFDLIISIYDSLSALFQTLIECFETEVYGYKKGLFSYKRDLEIKIGRKHNPLSEYWKLFT